MDSIADMERIVHDLKVDRDTWQAVALQYKEAFETQSNRLQQLQDVCFAAQAELENERAQRQRLRVVSDGRDNHRPTSLDGVEDLGVNFTFGTAAVYAPIRTEHLQLRLSSEDCTNPLFERVQECITQRSLLCYELRLLHQAREAFSTISDNELLPAKADELSKSYDDDQHLLRCTKRRSGFDESRTMEGLLAQLEDKNAEVLGP